ncbi:MAG: B12-binding domain-containing radical SAM protein [Acidobacteria bacterium]|nr:B12-binding domain-containing radical SAM protein [Acidobacteriota bacterium]
MTESRYILLISPPVGKSQLGKVPMPPLGLASIAAVLEEDGHKVEILDCPLRKMDYPDLEKALKEKKPEIVGITGTTWTRYEQFESARVSKKILPDTPVLVGGPHVTFTGPQTLEKIPEIDVIIKGEGELPFCEYVKAFPDEEKIKKIQSLTVRYKGNIVDNPVAEFITDLNTLPEPARHLLDLEAYGQTLFGKRATTIMTSRGCPIFCSFCSTSVMWGERNRRRSPEKVADEIENLIKTYDLGAIWFFDDTLTLNRQHIVGLLDEFEKRKMDFIWYCEIRVNTVDYDLLKRMYDLGCRYVSFGVESASERILKRINKGINLKQVLQVIQWCIELGIYMKAFFMFGLPDETYEDGLETVNFLKEHGKDINDVALSAGCSILPGTEVEEYAKAIGQIPKDFDWTEEIYYPENKMNNRPVAIPTLLQPQLGLTELNRLKFEYYGKGAINWYNIKSRVRSIRSIGDFINFMKLGFVFLAYILKLGSKKKPKKLGKPFLK